MMISGKQKRMKRKDKIQQAKTVKKPRNSDIINQTVSSGANFSQGDINYDDLVDGSNLSNSMEQDYIQEEEDDDDITQQLRDQISDLLGQLALKNEQNKELR